MDPVELFYQVDEFLKVYEQEIVKHILPNNQSNRRQGLMFPSEIITLRIMYHNSGYKTVKDFFVRNNAELRSYFPRLVSYSRFVELCTELVLPFMVFAKIFCTVESDGISYIDSTKLEACHVRRASGLLALRPRAIPLLDDSLVLNYI